VTVRTVTMTSENGLLAVWCEGSVESVTVTFTGKVPLSAVLPLMVPDDGSMERPAGNPLALHVNGAVPLAAAMGALYGEFTTPTGTEVVDMLSAGAMTSENGLDTL